MKPAIKAGAYGWSHAHWSDDSRAQSYYPQDLPQEWRLGYYSNDFDRVLVPAASWQEETLPDCEDWLHSVHPEFRFFVECRAGMLQHIALSELTVRLQDLQPQLAALVFPDEMPTAENRSFGALIDSLDVAVYTAGDVGARAARAIWTEAQPLPSDFALFDNDLTDLKPGRTFVDAFGSQLDDATQTATIIVHHASLQAVDLKRFCAMLEIMGY